MSARNTRAAVLPYAVLFRSEVREAKLLGFRVQAQPSPTGITIRLQPVTPQARAVARRSGHPDGAIHATAPYPQGGTAGDRLDVVRETLRAALELAKDSAA